MVTYINTFIDTYSTEIVGGLLTAILLLGFSYIKDTIKNLKIRQKYAGYIGSYYLYEFSSTGLDVVFAAPLSIKSKFGKLVIESNDPVYSYVGKMDITERNLYMHLSGIEHLEQVHMVFHSPLHRSIKRIVGTVVAISPIDEPIAKYCILSDEEIPINIAKQYLLNLTSEQTSDVLKVKKDNLLYFDNLDKNELDIYMKEKSS